MYVLQKSREIVRDAAVNGYDTTELDASEKATLRLRARSLRFASPPSSVCRVEWWWRWCSVLRGYASAFGPERVVFVLWCALCICAM